MDDRQQCEFVKGDGARCRAKVRSGATLCFAHDPATADQRTAAREADGHTRANKAEVAKRVEAVMRLRLAGAEFWDLREVAQSTDPEAGKEPWDVSDDQLRRYVTAANDLMAQEMEARRNVLLARHLAQRHHLYAKCMAQGDYRAALLVLQDEAKLQRLYLPESGNALEALLALLPETFAGEIRAYLAGLVSPGTGQGSGNGLPAGPAAAGPEPHPEPGGDAPRPMAGQADSHVAPAPFDALFEASG